MLGVSLGEKSRGKKTGSENPKSCYHTRQLLCGLAGWSHQQFRSKLVDYETMLDYASRQLMAQHHDYLLSDGL